MIQKELIKTLTEIEEKTYRPLPQIRISEIITLFMVLSLFSLILFSCSGNHHYSSGTSKQTFSNSHTCNEKCYPGIAYTQACQAVFLAIDPGVKYGMENWFAGKCRDLTDEEIENAPNGPGSGYHDAQDAAENSNQYAGDPEVFQMDDETIVIVDEGVQII